MDNLTPIDLSTAFPNPSCNKKIWLIIIVVLVVAIFFYILYKQKLKTNKALQILQKQIEKASEEERILNENLLKT